MAPDTDSPRIKIPNSVIVRVTGLLPMLYKPSELADDLHMPERTLRDWLAKFGAPHSRDRSGCIWINGIEFSAWVETVRRQKKTTRLQPGQAYCLRCKQPVDLVDPDCVVQRAGAPKRIKATCPQCGGTVYRGVSGKMEGGNDCAR